VTCIARSIRRSAAATEAVGLAQSISPIAKRRPDESAHLRVTGGEKAIRLRGAWILLDREEQLWRCLAEAPAEEMRGAYYKRDGPTRARGLSLSAAST
jgi:hypothetical protein